MKTSWKIARLFGIDVYVHVTFLLVPMMVLFVALSGNAGFLGLISMMALVLALFVCVVLHEYGHALTARAFGISTRDITLLPIGGLARLEGMPRKPMHEFLISIAGPLVNVVIAMVLAAILIPFVGLSELFQVPAVGGQRFLQILLSMNILLVIFNMIPAFPMDGGRVLRATLAGLMPYEKATLIATRVGQMLAIGFGLYGFLSGNWTLPFIAAFVFMGAGAELRQVRQQRMFENLWGQGQSGFGPTGPPRQNPYGGAAHDPGTVDSTGHRIYPGQSPEASQDETDKPPVRSMFRQAASGFRPGAPGQPEADGNANQRVQTIYLPNGGFINIIQRGPID